MKALAEANISPGLKQVAIHCAAAWPYRQAQQSIQRLIGVSISHEQIRQLCLQEAAKVAAQEPANFPQVYEQALAETVEVLVEEQPRPKKPPRIKPSERVHLGIDGALVNARAQNRFIEAKVGIVFSHQLAVVGTNRRQWLNKQYVGTLHQFISNNQVAMIDCHRFQQAGYYIGSAVVEKAVDLLVCRRQKLRGQNWSRTGADRLLCWRQMILNDQWDDYWQPAKAA